VAKAWHLLYNAQRLAQGLPPQAWIEDEELASFYKRVREGEEARAVVRSKLEKQLADTDKALKDLHLRANSDAARKEAVDKRQAVLVKIWNWVTSVREMALKQSFPGISPPSFSDLAEWSTDMPKRLEIPYKRAIEVLEKHGVVKPLISLVALVGSRVHTAPDTEEYNPALDDVVVIYSARNLILGACVQPHDSSMARVSDCGADGSPYKISEDPMGFYDRTFYLSTFFHAQVVCST